MQHDIYLFSNNKISNLDIIKQEKINYNFFFKNLYKLVIHHWKNENKIQNKNINYINCNVEYFNLLELKQIENNLTISPIIKDFMINSISYKKNNYDLFH